MGNVFLTLGNVFLTFFNIEIKILLNKKGGLSPTLLQPNPDVTNQDSDQSVRAHNTCLTLT